MIKSKRIATMSHVLYGFSFMCVPELFIGSSINITLVYDEWTNDLVGYHLDEPFSRWWRSTNVWLMHS